MSRTPPASAPSLPSNSSALAAAVDAAHQAGALMKHHLSRANQRHESHQHDFHLDLHARCQKLTNRFLARCCRHCPAFWC